MGLLDRIRKKEDSGAIDGNDPAATEPPVDRSVRGKQLDQLSNSLRLVARQMASESERMGNPGWRGQVMDLRNLAAEADALSGTEFTMTEIYDIVASVGPLPKQPEYLPYAEAWARLEAARQALREVLPSEQQPPES